MIRIKQSILAAVVGCFALTFCACDKDEDFPPSLAEQNIAILEKYHPSWIYVISCGEGINVTSYRIESPCLIATVGSSEYCWNMSNVKAFICLGDGGLEIWF